MVMFVVLTKTICNTHKDYVHILSRGVLSRVVIYGSHFGRLLVIVEGKEAPCTCSLKRMEYWGNFPSFEKKFMLL